MKSALIVVLLSTAAAAHPAVSKARLLPDTWANRSSFFVGVRSGLAVPPGASSLAPNLSLEMGVATPKGFGMGIRAMWMNQPPGVPFLGLNPGTYGFGAMADFRVYIETIDPLIIYPTLAVGFLAGPDAVTGKNLVLPLFNPGLGAKLQFGNFYVGFEFGLSGFTIPFMAMTLGYQMDSKIEKQRARLKRAGVLPEGDEELALEAPVAPQAAAPARPQPGSQPERAVGVTPVRSAEPQPQPQVAPATPSEPQDEWQPSPGSRRLDPTPTGTLGG